ncbi:MAG: NAD(P)-dependent oxidoreductase [Aquificae bacterium]|nr:NAD(P)-dependent oxidoreductase [Aquificota bacterium]
MRIGWIGLGHMGKPMAKNLIEAGYDVKVWNRTVSVAKESGLPYTEDLKQLVEESDVIITMLFHSQSVEEIYTKIVQLGVPLQGKTFIDMTTVHPNTAKKIAELVIKHGADFLEAPVLGSVIPATQGKLTILVSGEESKFKELEDIFKVLGEKIFFMGDYSRASTMKLINNTVLGSFMAVLSEAFAFGKKAGLDDALVLDVLSHGAGKSGVLEAKKEKLLKEDYSTHFSVALIHKDICYALDIAKDLDYPCVITTQTLSLYTSAKANDLEDKDFSAVLEIYKKLANINKEE